MLLFISIRDPFFSLRHFSLQMKCKIDLQLILGTAMKAMTVRLKGGSMQLWTVDSVIDKDLHLFQLPASNKPDILPGDNP